MKIGKWYRVLVDLFATVALVSVILAAISRLIMHGVGLTQGSYMSLATFAILVAIYFLIEGTVAARK